MRRSKRRLAAFQKPSGAAARGASSSAYTDAFAAPRLFELSGRVVVKVFGSSNTGTVLQTIGRVNRGDLGSVYRFEKTTLGNGHSGQVRLVTNKYNGVRYVCKSSTKVNQQRAVMNLLRNEIQVLLKCDHPHVARLVDLWEDDSAVHSILEYCPNGDLLRWRANQPQPPKSLSHMDTVTSSHIKTENLTENVTENLPWEEVEANFWKERELQARQIMRQVIRTLCYLHHAGIVHRDIKPDHFLVESSHTPIDLRARDFPAARRVPFVKLIDFGLARSFSPTSRPMRTTCGTLAYTAPEVLLGSYNQLCDLWSAGCLGYFLLFGDPLFHGAEDFIVWAILNFHYPGDLNSNTAPEGDATPSLTPAVGGGVGGGLGGGFGFGLNGYGVGGVGGVFGGDGGGLLGAGGASPAGSYSPKFPCPAHMLSADCHDFLRRLLAPLPSDRLTAAQAWRHPWLEETLPLTPASISPMVMDVTRLFVDVPLALALLPRRTFFKNLVLAMMSFSLSGDAIRQLQDLFLFLDIDAKGELDIDDLHSFLLFFDANPNSRRLTANANANAARTTPGTSGSALTPALTPAVPSPRGVSTPGALSSPFGSPRDLGTTGASSTNSGANRGLNAEDGVNGQNDWKRLQDRAALTLDPEKVANSMDVFKRGSVSFSDFLSAFLGTSVLPTQHTQLLATFWKFDRKRSGQISVDNLREVLGSLYHDRTLERFIRQADRDGDKFIDFSEFTHIINNVE